MSTGESGVELTANYAINLADGSYDWYKKAAIKSRRAYRLTETSLVIVAAAIPTSAAVASTNIVIPAVLGGVVVVITGLRSVFHWQENYLRFNGAREAIEAERRLYRTGSEPYDQPSSRDKILAAAVTRIESEEMSGWLKVATERPKP